MTDAPPADSVAEAVPAATLILFRPAPGGAPDRHLPDQHLIVQRGAAMAFAAGAVVFPGGRVDAGDHAHAALIGGAEEPEILAAKIAAIRETIEETGVAVGIEPAPSPATLAAWRAALAAGVPFAALLAGHRLVPERLAPFARWLPRVRTGRRFDTRFFIAEAPADADPIADGGESVRAFWADAATVIAEAEAGRLRMIFPTVRNMERLAAIGTHAAALAHLTRYPVRVVTPHQEERDGTIFLCIPEDAGYPVTAQPMDAVQRG